MISDSPAIVKGVLCHRLICHGHVHSSMLNIASSMVAYDLINPLRNNKLTDKQQLYLAKAAGFTTGILSVFLASYARKHGNALLRLMFLYFDLGNSTFVAPFLLAVWGFRGKEKIAVLGMVVGAITITLWKKFIPGINGSFVEILANGITMILAHYGLPGKDFQGFIKPSLDHQ